MMLTTREDGHLSWIKGANVFKRYHHNPVGLYGTWRNSKERKEEDSKKSTQGKIQRLLSSYF